MDRIIIVSNRLPLTMSFNKDEVNIIPNPGGLARGLNASFRNSDCLWVGWPGFPKESKGKNLDGIRILLEEQRMAPVFLSKQQIDLFSAGFCNSTLWPLFHYFPRYASFSEDQWEAYRQVNELFCEEVMKHADNDSIIWIHDYHLLLLPALIRERLPQARIGYFQHVPFPAQEIFRILPTRLEILQGIMGADLIGFHTYDDTRHFLGSVNRILGLDNKMGEMRYQRRVVYADAFPMGIQYEHFESAAQSDNVRREIGEFGRQCGNVKLILSVDRLDYSKGIPERLKAFELFLDQNPGYSEKVSLMMIVTPSREKVALYKKLKTEIDELVGNINARFRTMTWTPILYFYRSFPGESLSALYKMADAALITPLRDGMNLVCKEYVASRTDETGVLILSEMAGAARELNEALIINPYNIQETAGAIRAALEMDTAEQRRRMQEMQGRLRKYNASNWVKCYLDKLMEVCRKRQTVSVKVVSPEISEKIVSDFSASERRMLFLDYDGTLMPIRNKPELARPDSELLDILKSLSEEPGTQLVVLTERDRNTMGKWFGEMNTIDIIAEHGLWKKKQGEEWIQTASVSGQWKSNVMPLMEQFVSRTPGSFIEEKDYSLAWHFRMSDPDLAETRSRELIDLLQYLTLNQKLNVVEGNKVVEVKCAEINKGWAVAEWLNKDYDFILAAGDDLTDEDMFKAMPPHAYTIKIGHSPSLAHYNILAGKNDSSAELRLLLKALAEIRINEGVK